MAVLAHARLESRCAKFEIAAKRNIVCAASVSYDFAHCERRARRKQKRDRRENRDFLHIRLLGINHGP